MNPQRDAVYPSLKGLPVLVTGGGAGIGAAIVAHFAAQGARVGFIEIDPRTAGATAELVAGATGRAPAYRVADLRDIAAAKAAAEALAAECGSFRVLVNNAANDDRHPLEEVTPDYWDERMAVNLRHQFFMAQQVAPGMAAAGGGSIVNFGSISWMFGAAGLIAYTTAKAAVGGMTKSLARELGDRNIRVNAIAPGWILTERQVSRAKATAPDKFADYLARQCLKQHLMADDVARLVLWLAADDSRMATGQTFILDGGVV
jgi:NAD(P)-dependent dehydrogenase (short-subunit alcohol dehydrogenase family)